MLYPLFDDDAKGLILALNMLVPSFGLQFISALGIVYHSRGVENSKRIRNGLSGRPFDK
jgi:hypothetical protein